MLWMEHCLRNILNKDDPHKGFILMLFSKIFEKGTELLKSSGVFEDMNYIYTCISQSESVDYSRLIHGKNFDTKI